MQKKRIENIIIFSILIIATVVLIKKISTNIQKIKGNTTQNEISVVDGVNAIKELEQKNVMEIEDKIEKLRVKDPKDIDFKYLFSSSVIMGDSISEALVGYNILNKSSVVAYKGRNTISAMNDVQTVINLRPRKIFMAYGMNDVLVFNGNASNFVKQYEKLINKVKEGLPNSTIYISSILPVQQKAINKESGYKSINECNIALKNMCKKLGLTYIDTTHLLDGKSELYEGDGIHMKIKFYPFWLNKLSEVEH